MSDFDSRLIGLIRGNPNLFEREIRSTPYAAKRKDKEELWRNIATILQTDVKTCTTRWEHLKLKLHRELAKEAEGVGSTWSLLPKMRFLNPGCRAVRAVKSPQPSSDALIEEVHDEEDTLQEAMDEQSTAAMASGSAQIPSSRPTALTPTDTMRRVGVLLEGLGEEDCVKAGKRIIAYLCKCNLRALECKSIDDLVI